MKDLLLDSCEIIQKQRLKELFEIGAPLKDDFYVHTHCVIQGKSFRPGNYDLDYTPTFDIVEPYSDSLNSSECAFSILDDLNNDKGGTTILSIGLNPKGNDNQQNTNTGVPSILSNACRSFLEPTRRNILKHSYKTEEINKPISRIVQVDLFSDRTEKANNINTSSLMLVDNNFENIKFWIEKADIIIPNWGEGINKFIKQNAKKYQKLIELLNENLNKVYIIGVNCDGSPIHSATSTISPDEPLIKATGQEEFLSLTQN